MSFRVGMDLVDVSDVRGALDARPERYLGRIFTDREVTECTRMGTVDPRRLASRFAAKEAVIKVLQPGTGESVPWRSIDVHRPSTGTATVHLDGLAAELAERERIGGISIDLSDQGPCAAAVAVAEIGRPR